jgi:carboxyl-terminal processing protease
LKNDTLKKKDGKDKDGKSDDKGAPQADAKPSDTGKDKAGDEKDKDKAADAALDAFTHFGDPTNDYQLARAIDLLHGLSLYKGASAKTTN